MRFPKEMKDQGATEEMRAKNDCLLAGHIKMYLCRSYIGKKLLSSVTVCSPGPAAGGWAAQGDITVGRAVAGSVTAAAHACPA